jgi:hypothetical protein
MNTISAASIVKKCSAAELQTILLQALISSVPAVVAVAMLPYALSGWSAAIELVGLSFALIRMGMVAGGYLAAWVQDRPISYRALLSMGELLAAALGGGLVFGIISHSTLAVLIILTVRAIVNGTVGATRAGYLRALGREARHTNLLVAIQTITQASYGIAGAFIGLTNPGQLGALWMLGADAVTSILGAMLFALMPRHSFPSSVVPGANRDPKASSCRALLHTLQPEKRWLLAGDLLITGALSGTNILLVQMGGGASLGRNYGMMLVLYAVAYAFAGRLATIDKESRAYWLRKFMARWGAGGVALCLVLLAVSNNPTAVFGGGFALFLMYGTIAGQLERAWFAGSSAAGYPKWSAFRNLVRAIILALGEAMFATTDIRMSSLRVVMAMAAAMCFVAMRRRLVSLRISEINRQYLNQEIAAFTAR